MVVLGNLLTHYRYQLANVSAQERDGRLAIQIRTNAQEADLDLVADLTSTPAPLPRGSPFTNLADTQDHFPTRSTTTDRPDQSSP